jgi:cell division septation protein DedD
LIILALIGIANAAWFYLKPDKFTEFYQNGVEKIQLLFTKDEGKIIIVKDSTDNEAIDTTAIETPDSATVTDSTDIEEVVETQEELPTNNSTVQNYEGQAVKGMFYIIGGGFSKQQNAQSYVKQLIEKGYPAFILDKSGSLHRVTYGGWKTEAEAEQELKKIRQNHNKEAWILEY